MRFIWRSVKRQILTRFVPPGKQFIKDVANRWPALFPDLLKPEITFSRRQRIVDVLVEGVTVSFAKLRLGVVITKDVPNAGRGADTGLI